MRTLNIACAGARIGFGAADLDRLGRGFLENVFAGIEVDEDDALEDDMRLDDEIDDDDEDPDFDEDDDREFDENDDLDDEDDEDD